MVSAKADGTDFRVDIPSRDKAGDSRLWEQLFVSGDQMYLLYTAKNTQLTPQQLADVKVNALRKFLVRFYPKKGTLGSPVLLPEVQEMQGACDGGFFYFTGRRNAPTWRSRFDVLFSESATQGEVRRSLYRIALPK